MGKKFIVFDDIDGTEDAETRTFGIGGTAYEIDLVDANYAKLEKVLAPFTDKARKAGRATPVRVAATRKGPNPELDAIRHWASKNGHRVSDKGRIPQDVVKAYDEAHAPRAEEAKAPAGKAPAGKAVAPAFSAT